MLTVRMASYTARRPFGVRSVSFAASEISKPKVCGLRKDPEEYIYSAHGTKYPGTPETLEPARKFLGKFTLPDALLLQCLVHKSFAHAKFPYNEKLGILGQQLFRLEAHRAVTLTSESLPSDHTVNGKNFNVGSGAVEVLTSTPVIAKICDMAGLESALFYKTKGNLLTPSIKARAVHALIGALVLERGQIDAINFINERLLSSEFSVFDLASNLNVHN